MIKTDCMSNVKSPYNFVPVSKEVFFPDWAELVSHDIPFSDGESGYIDVRITAETPIYIRNWHTEQDKNNRTERYKSFCKDPQGRYLIPGTSLKGEVRSVMEVLSFGKMHLDGSMAFATPRDLRKGSKYPLLNSQKAIRCGYLKFNNGRYLLTDCGKPYRIGHREIDEYVETVRPDKKGILSSVYCKDSCFNLNKEVQVGGKNYDPKTAEYKYKLLEGICLEGLNFRYKEESAGRTIVAYDPYGDIHGDIVLTGSPNKWASAGKKNSKYYEFVFPAEETASYPLPEEKFEEYKFIYGDRDTFKDSVDKGKGIPVFFRIENGEIKDLGLTFLYKLPYSHTPEELLDERHKSICLDLAETIFGMASQSKGRSLKGRVQFSHLFATEVKEHDKDVTLTLGAPKASYYPMYIRQHGNGDKTYDNDDAELAGRKRYVVRNTVWSKTSTDNVDTTFRPLDKGSTFNGRVYFHNLRPMEIGAILSALTFHGTGICRHQLGLARPYGYGRIKIDVSRGSLAQECGWYMSVFEKTMRSFKNDWLDCEQIRELLSLATPITVDDNRFRYLDLDMKNVNEFDAVKEEHQYLKLHSLITGNITKPESIFNRYEEQRIQQEEEEKRLRHCRLKDQAAGQYSSGQLEEAYETYIQIQYIGIEDVSGTLERLGKEIVGKLMANIDNLKQQSRYQEALDICDILKNKWKHPIASMTEELESLLHASEKESITQGFTLNSTGACANTIKKWKATHEGIVSDNELEALASIIKEQLPEARKKLQKKWSSEKEWGPIRKEIGEEKAHRLFEMINGR
ncbi:MAG: TIGR03986 family CRISPR-associated RAMP protein [Candidatus Cryptobacteroides sp.]